MTLIFTEIFLPLVGVCETMKRIVAKAVLMIIRQDILDASGSAQVCAGHLAGVEAAVHAVYSLFCDESSTGILLVNASNAFNSLNRITALHNILHLCPAFTTLAINCYRHPSSLFASGTSLLSEEGTTQGDPLAMPLYALVTIPLINTLTLSNDTKQVWYVDDSAATRSIMGIRQWFNSLVRIGPSYGYYVNVEKTWLVVKPQYLQDAVSAFADTKSTSPLKADHTWASHWAQTHTLQTWLNRKSRTGSPFSPLSLTMLSLNPTQPIAPLRTVSPVSGCTCVEPHRT